MLTIHVWPRWLKAFLLAHDLYKSPRRRGSRGEMVLGLVAGDFIAFRA